ncbi:MAG: hypothetical protein D6719_07750, partial [Candidatus Dadabacteria bacterium]
MRIKIVIVDVRFDRLISCYTAPGTQQQLISYQLQLQPQKIRNSVNCKAESRFQIFRLLMAGYS